MAAVSVIIPAYNSEGFIKETLDSVLRQTLKDVEIVVVNDGSTDSTGEIIASYCEKYDNIKYITQENSGVSAARNNGLMHATGEYVVFLDADDYFTDGSLEAFYGTAKSTGADCVVGRLRYFDESGMGEYHEQSEQLSRMQSIDCFDKLLLWDFLIGNKCYNRKRLLSSGVKFPPFTFSEEGAFFMSFVYTGAKLSGTDGSCMLYRIHTAKQGASASQRVTKESAYNMLCSLNMIKEKAEEALYYAAGIDRDEYMQEVTYKAAHILVSQFYRSLWKTDDSGYKYIVDELTKLIKGLTKQNRERLFLSNPDLYLEKLNESRAGFAGRAKACFIIKPVKGRNYNAVIRSLYAQTCPDFQLIMPQSVFDALDSELKADNITVITGRDYMAKVKKASAAEYRAVVKSDKVLDERVLRFVITLKAVPEKIRRIFFSKLLSAVSLMLKIRS
ncbi:MAG: glycosyltransferase [Clostridia bacterium]|nr:glycosyltransferase [Clostridia bacterium]